MTVNTTTASQTFQGNGVATAFPCQFEIFLPTDIDVYFVNPTTGAQTPAVLNSDYTVAGAGASSGFTVNTTVPVPTGTNLYVVRALPLTQPTDFTNQGAFFPNMHEAAMDRLCMLIQQIANYSEGLNITMPPGLVPQPSTLFPIPLAGSLIGWNTAGTALVNVGPSGIGAGSIADINIANNAAIQAVKLSYTPSGTGAVTRSVQAKLAEHVSVMDFGAVADGATDCTAAFQAAINAVAVAGGAVEIPNGNFVVGALTLASGVTIRGASEFGANLIPKSAAITIFSGTSLQDVVLDNFSINCGSLATIVGVSLVSCNYSSITRIAFQGCNQTFKLDQCNNIRISGCTSLGTPTQGAGGCTIWSSSDSAYIHNIVLDDYDIRNIGNGVQATCVYVRRGVAVQLARVNCNDAVTGGIAQNFIVIENDCQGCKIEECGCGASLNGLLVHTGSGVAVAPTFLTVVNFDSDQCQSSHISIGNGSWISIFGGNYTSSGVATTASAIVIGGAQVLLSGLTVDGYNGTNGAAYYMNGVSRARILGCLAQSCYFAFVFAGTNTSVLVEGCDTGGCTNQVNGPLPSDTGSFIYHNMGFKGFSATTPAMPASGAFISNPNPFPCRIALSGGTVSNVYIGPVGKSATAFTVSSPAFIEIEPGEAIAVIYSAAPTWTWIGK